MTDVTMSAGTARDWLSARGYPFTDNVEFHRSDGEFDGGGQFGVEIPAVNSMRDLEIIVKLLNDQAVRVTRFNETLGSSCSRTPNYPTCSRCAGRTTTAS